MAIDVGTRISNLARSQGISIRKLAQMAGIPCTTLQSIVSRKSKVDVGTAQKVAAALRLPMDVLLDAGESCFPMWVSVKVRLPELDEDEPFARCIVNVIRWCEGWTGPWNQPEPDLNEEEFTAAAAYNPEQKTFTVYDGFGDSMVINALLDPNDFSGSSGMRITHWMPMPSPFGVLKEEEKTSSLNLLP